MTSVYHQSSLIHPTFHKSCQFVADSDPKGKIPYLTRRLPQAMKMLSSTERSIVSSFETRNVTGLTGRLPQAMRMVSSTEQSIISSFETHNVTGLHDGHLHSSLCRIVINTSLASASLKK